MLLNLLCGALAVGGYITIFSSVITLIIVLFDKNKKSSVKGSVIAFAVGILLVVLSFMILKIAQ